MPSDGTVSGRLTDDNVPGGFSFTECWLENILFFNFIFFFNEKDFYRNETYLSNNCLSDCSILAQSSYVGCQLYLQASDRF